VTHELILLVTHYGLLIVGTNVLLNQVGLPVPAFPTLIVAGAIAANGDLGVVPLFVLSVSACLIADSGWFLVGRVYGIRVLKTLCRVSLEPDSCVSQTQTRFETWGVNSLVFAKFVPGLATIAPPLAGALRIRWARFIALSSLGAMLWVGSGLAVGELFKSQIDALLHELDHIGRIAVLMVVGLLAAYIAFKAWERARFFKNLRMARINVADLYELMQAGAAPVIIDARSPTARALEPRWIPTAIHVPLQDAARHIRELPLDRDIIVYCTCPNEASAAQVAKILMNHGLKKVRPLTGGLDAWIAAGYEVAAEAPIALKP
jgi:membrane protein DedA with SNARE-associated domain/rhodanese-related sulfurtransferase